MKLIESTLSNTFLNWPKPKIKPNPQGKERNNSIQGIPNQKNSRFLIRNHGTTENRMTIVKCKIK
jgi:hypothetical protein